MQFFVEFIIVYYMLGFQYVLFFFTGYCDKYYHMSLANKTPWKDKEILGSNFD